jgi:hypothetical protein
MQSIMTEEHDLARSKHQHLLQILVSRIRPMGALCACVCSLLIGNISCNKILIGGGRLNGVQPDV